MLPVINSRAKPETLKNLKTVTNEEHRKIKLRGAVKNDLWEIENDPDSHIVKRFRSEAKSYYWSRQARRCCYCSKELDNHKGTYDAEHIIPKDTHPQFMFELSNIAAACKTCNGAKSNKPILTLQDHPLEVPQDSEAYKIVHPQIDEWSEFLGYDRIGRIYAINKNLKANETIRICGINSLNAARLADYFLPADNDAAQKALEAFFRVNSIGWKKKYVTILRKMVDDFNLGKARAIISILEEEVETPVQT